MGEVKRIYPESKTGLINWIEQNFHDIDQYVVCFQMKDGTTMTVSDVYNHVTGLGLAEVIKSNISEEVFNDDFTPKVEPTNTWFKDLGLGIRKKIEEANLREKSKRGE